MFKDKILQIFSYVGTSVRLILQTVNNQNEVNEQEDMVSICPDP